MASLPRNPTDEHVSQARTSLDSDPQDDMNRRSGEVRQYDREITAEEEAERLLTSGKKDSRNQKHEGASDRRRERRKSRWLGDGDAENALLYKLERGGRSSSAESSANSSEVGMQHVCEAKANRKSKATWCGRLAAIHFVIVVAFSALLFGAYTASHADITFKKTNSVPRVLSNGTHQFAPTTILISLDGFRADFLHRNLTPTLSAFVKEGVSPKYMLPSFPSLTFPNHFTLVTGQYPEAHGIVGNSFWDPHMGQEFYYTDPEKSMKPEYWNAEPLWSTAESQDLYSAIHMWPGSEAHILPEPTYVDKFNMDEPLDNKVKRILGWLDLPGADDAEASLEQPRPQLIAAYVPDVDADGHTYGPNSTYIRSTIAEVDGMMGSLFRGITARNLTDVVNVVIVSDHGMATTSSHRLIQFEDLIDPDLVEHIDGWPLYGLRPRNQSQDQLQKLYAQLVEKSNLPQYRGNFDVYLRDQNMPERYHFSNNDRIAPLWLMPKTGWAIVTKEEFDIQSALDRDEVYHPRGLHGYDLEHPLMRAIFIARGPAFPHPQGSEVEPFQNIEVYNIVCDSLGIKPQPNNGTIRLPFKTVGLHDLNADPEIPDDAFEIDMDAAILPPELPGLDELPTAPSRPTTPSRPSPDKPSPTPTQPDRAFDPEPPVDRPVVQDGEAAQQTKKQSWLDWINAELHGVKVWAGNIFGSGNNDKEAKEGNDAR
ncbi:hypothetical protein DOTSEDRAFT_144256 [Dothistroma septosporum NZE10]|uniref:Phosphodiest-domain-containing protein n=1 Tax=Dothistroma septosporum (strain NZE10 / CBS 128990) TaxID=675120 RepID=N1Q2C7_DOTSN|nr:hypothetical protein DOTSEDRAFT_144256 [Dothistroma septosporum NZE10]